MGPEKSEQTIEQEEGLGLSFQNPTHDQLEEERMNLQGTQERSDRELGRKSSYGEEALHRTSEIGKGRG